MARWLVHSEWLPTTGERSPSRLTQRHPDQFVAERAGLHLACCAGTRYVSVEGPGAIVTLDWDRYTTTSRAGTADTSERAAPSTSRTAGSARASCTPGSTTIRCGARSAEPGRACSRRD
jgi:hypothetical protein